MKIIKSLLLSVSVFLFFGFIFFQNDFIQKISSSLEEYKIHHYPEKLFIHTDKHIYTPKEKVWFKVYLVEGVSLEPRSLSTVAYVDLIDSKGTSRYLRNIYIYNGGGNGDIFLPDSLPPGKYFLRGYTNMMKNFGEEHFFKKEINIVDFTESNEIISVKKTSTKPSLRKVDPNFLDVKFYPESGNLIEGVSGFVSIEALDGVGKGVEVKGEILDDRNNFITAFSTYKFGLGLAQFKPVSGRKYHANIIYNNEIKNFPINQISRTGFAIKCRNLDNSILVSIVSNKSLEKLNLIAHTRGELQLALPIDTNKKTYNFTVEKNKIPFGLFTITLFDRDNKPVSERLIFNEYTGREIHTSLSKPVYTLRNKVSYDLHFNREDTTSWYNLSLSISNPESINRKTEKAGNIISYMLLSSDVPIPEYFERYFGEADDEKKYILLDLILMSRGWKKFEWSNLVDKRWPKIKYIVENGFAISGMSGRLLNEDNSVQADVFLTPWNTLSFDQVTTQDNGNFLFAGYHFFDSTEIVLQARRANKNNRAKKKALSGSKNVSITVNEILPYKASPFDVEEITFDSSLANFAHEKSRIKVVSDAYGQMVLEFDEIVVSAKRKEVDVIKSSGLSYYNEPTQRLILDSIPGYQSSSNIVSFLRGRVAGLRVEGVAPNEELYFIEGQSLSTLYPPLILLDRIPVTLDILQSINVLDIYAVDVLRRGQAAIFGGRGGGGVIAIYTRSATNTTERNDDSQFRKGITTYRHPGYYKPSLFTTPKYDRKRPEHIIPDYRSTLHWEPDIYSQDDSTYQVQFYTSDQTGDYEIIVQGIDNLGNPIFLKDKLSVR
jgi:hypothetical protein